MGGLANYRAQLAEVESADFMGYEFTRSSASILV
jgi:hypothetical protein